MRCAPALLTVSTDHLRASSERPAATQSPSGVKRPQNSYRPGRSTSACSVSQTRSAAGSVSASYVTFNGAGTTALRRRSNSVIGISLRVAGDGQAERVAVGAAVAGEQVLQR